LAEALQRHNRQQDRQQLLEDLRQRYPNEPKLNASPLLPHDSTLPLSIPIQLGQSTSIANHAP